MALPKVLTGARAILTIDGGLVVYATNVSYNIVTEYKEIQGVDNSLPEELSPTKISVEVRCSTLRVPKESASVLALQPTILNHLHQRYVSIEIQDRGTSTTILYVPKAMMTGRAGAVGARSLAGETWTFRGIGYWDERPPQEAKEKAGEGLVNDIANLARKIKNPFG